MQANVGDDITVSGTVIEAVVTQGLVLMQTSAGWRYWIRVKDIKAVRPQGNNGGGVMAIVKEGVR